MKVLAFIITLLSATFAQASDLVFDNPWVPIAPPVAKAHAAFATIYNKSGAPKTLVSIESDHYLMVHLHKSQVIDDVATMSMVHQIEIPAGGTLLFQPGGLHIMLMGPKTAKQLGDEISITLNFEDGTSYDMKAIVKARHAGS